MRLLFVSNLYPTVSSPNRGRPNARLLRRFAPEHDVRLIVARPKFLPPYADGVRRQADEALQEDAAFSPHVVHVPYAPKIGSLLNHTLYARGIRRAFDAVLAEGCPDAILVGWLFPDMCGVIQLAKRHGIPVFGISQGSDAHQYLDMPRRRQVILQGCAAAAGIITRSQDLANRLAGAGVPKEKLRTVYNGVETDLFRPGDRAEARRRLGLPADAPVLLYVGNLLPIKNPDLLLEAFAPLPPNAQLVYVGEGERLDALRARAVELGLAERVRLAGLQPPAQVVTYMQAANLLVVPSRNEGIPNVIREAFACALPVVSTNVGGIAEVIDQDWLGSLVPSEDPTAMASAIATWLAASPDAARIRTHAEGFSWENTVAGCLDFIRERIGI
jgi:glycosyltransferase involved in cell wall biosynthesis